LLTFSLAAGIAPLLPWWIPAGQPRGISRHDRPALCVPVMLAWGVVLFVTIILCIDPNRATTCWARADAEHRQHGHAVARADDDRGRLVLTY